MIASAPRKSRRKRIAISQTEGAPPRWQVTANDWDNLESIYGSKFNDEFRDCVTKIVEHYLFHATAEYRAPYVDEVAKKLREARNLTKELQKTVSSANAGAVLVERSWRKRVARRENSEADHATGSRAEAEIFADAWAFDPNGRLTIETFHDATRAILSTLEKTLLDLRQGEAGFVEGEAWQIMVRGLADMLRLNQIEVSAAKGDGQKTSIFVLFIERLQFTLFPKFRRGSTLGALSKLVSRAIRGNSRSGTQSQT